VLYNVTVGAFACSGKTAEAEKRALEVLRHLHMEDQKDLRAGNLTIADRKRLEIARALATRPKLLLLDEVMAGLRPTEVDEMVAIIKQLRDSGMTIFVIEHIMRAIMALSDRIAVLHFEQRSPRGSAGGRTRRAGDQSYLGKSMALLEVKNIDVFYGDVQVVFGLSLKVEEGEVVSIIGGNGAGKSTL
jgi:ABC-type branched-subunit amino acid transport system ATPase component